MGSYGNAIMAGFICRLCSEQKKCVIHLYSVKAKKLSLLKKIKLIPIKVDKYDKLPKTICQSCIAKLDMQYHLIQQIRKSADIQRTHRLFHNNGRCPVECPLHGIYGELEAERNDIECVEDVRNQNELNDEESGDIQVGDVEILENDTYEIFNTSEADSVHENETVYAVNDLI
ncbi:zinc-finger associated domain containing protein [Oryctes borbonicus]|uniref:Zinc-finger associated domain containing protein n=1 Tax=Oryctes borbonicus TaxID=1629725 RepID=A0A0T6ASW3_9SCAR|nr:zinc-finger associated domain containing protein [Oryctes borbonicus]